MTSDGRSATPFKTLAPLQGADPDNPGDIIFVHENGGGAYAGGLVLENNQQLIGNGVALVVNSQTLVAAGSKPTITNSGGNGVTLASGNTVRGLIAQTTAAGGASAGIGGSSVGNFTANTIQVVGNPGAAIDIQTAGTLTVTLESASSTTGTQGLRVTGATGGTFTVSGATTVTNAVTTGINLATNGTATFNFTGGATVSTTAGTGILASSSGTVNISSGSVAATGGPALNVNPTTIAMTFTSLTSTSSTTTGISLTSASGSLTTGSTTVTNAAGIGINVQGLTSGATASFGTTSVTNPDGDIIGDTGVRLIDNVGNVSFGDLDITPESNDRGLHATNAVANSGTITTTSGTISASGGVAVEITRTAGTIPLTMTLTSVSANGGTSGIILTRTSGSFSITGGGNMTQGGDSSGGTIQNTSAAGISLTDADNLSLNNMNIHNTFRSGIDGTLVNGFTFTFGTIDKAGLDNSFNPVDTGLGGVDVSNIAFNDIASGINNLSGTVSITNNVLTNAWYQGIDIYNESGTIGDLTISNNAVTSRTSTTQSQGSGIRVQANGSPSTGAAVTKATVSNNTVANFPIGVGIMVQGGNGALGPQATLGVPGSGTNIITITGNAIGGSSLAALMGSNPIQTAMTGTGQAKFSITNNGTAAVPLRLFKGIGITASGGNLSTAVYTIHNNFIDASENIASSSGMAVGAQLSPGQKTTFSASIQNNSLVGMEGNGILAGITNSGSASPNQSTGNFIIKNNTVGAPQGGVRPGIRVESGSTNGDSNVCLEISGNTSAGSGGSQGIGLRKQGTSTTVNIFGIVGLSPSPTGSPTVENFVDSQNPAGGGTLLISATTGFTSCSAFVVNSLPKDVTASSASLVTDDPAIDSSGDEQDILHSAPGEAPKDDNVQKLSQQELAFIVQAALDRWRQLGISAEDMARLQAVTFEIADLPTGQIATGDSTRIKIDETAAGYGWYFDQAPYEDSEFDVLVPNKELQTTELSPAHGRMDLLSVVMRQLGHVYIQGKDRLPKSMRKNLKPLMEGTLSPAVRRLPLDQLRTTISPTGSIKPSAKENLQAQLTEPAQPDATQTSSQPAVAQVESNAADARL